MVEKTMIVRVSVEAKPLSCHKWKVRGLLETNRATHCLSGQSRCVRIRWACEPTCKGCLHCWHTKFILLKVGVHEEADRQCRFK